MHVCSQRDVPGTPISRFFATLPAEQRDGPLIFVVLHGYSAGRAMEFFSAAESVSSQPSVQSLEGCC